MTEKERSDGEEFPAFSTIRAQITQLIQDLQQVAQHFHTLSNLWTQRVELESKIKAKDEEIQSFQERIMELEEQLSRLTPSEERLMGTSEDLTQQKRFLEQLSITLTKVFVIAKSIENLPNKLMRSIEETESILLKDGPPEMRVLVTLERLGGVSSASVLRNETSLTQEEVDTSIKALHTLGVIIEESPGLVRLLATKAIEPEIIQWRELTSINEIFKQCKHFTESTTDPNEIAIALDAMRDVLFAKGVSGVIVSEIAKEARKWRIGAGNREELMEYLLEWEQRSSS
ncbi:MAG: hypothetical protein ACE5R6_03725 [Candidatus Heimdallarchaeota archaeon]